MDGILAQDGLFGCNAPVILGDGRVMLARGVDVRVAEHVSNQVNIAGFPVEIGAEGAAQLVRADLFFERRGDGGVLLDHVFHGPLGDAPPLDREKESVFMAGQRFDLFALLEVILERAGNLVGQVQDDLLAALARDDERVLLKVKIVDVQAYAFADADARSQKQ